MRALPLLTLCALFSVTQPSPPYEQERCAVTPNFTFYEVQGNSAPEILAALREHGPRDERGKARFAYTDWDIEWTWRRASEKSIDVGSLQLLCKATIQLPKLTATPETPIELIRAWHDFVERTRVHELAHVSHVELAAPRIRQRLSAAHARFGQLSTARARAIVQQVIYEIRDLDSVYDQRTNHGRSEGTWGL